jgi:two-component system response regulator DevR
MNATPSLIRLAHIDDHEAMRLGFAAIVGAESDLALRHSAASAADILPVLDDIDLVVLDLRLADGSRPGDNVAALVDRGARVLCFSAAEDPVAVRDASKAGALGVVRKSESSGVLLEAIRATGRGEPIATLEWAAALDGDPRLAAAALSPKERLVLALYASGEKSVTVAAKTELSQKTVAEYVRRIRTKYALAGRPALSRVDLYKRAVEDGIVAGPDERGAAE